MNYIISIIHPDALDAMTELCQQLEMPMSIATHGRGTATRSMMDLLGIENNFKRIVLNVASPEKTRELIRELKRKLFLGMPGQGITIAVPVKSVGGGKTLAYLSGEQSPKYTPELNFDYELILAVANRGLHRSGDERCPGLPGLPAAPWCTARAPAPITPRSSTAVSLASEKEIVLILTKTGQKADIQRSILKEAGPDSPAGSVVFSLPGDGDRRVRIYERGGINLTPSASVQVAVRKPFSLASRTSAARRPPPSQTGRRPPSRCPSSWPAARQALPDGEGHGSVPAVFLR